MTLKKTVRRLMKKLSWLKTKDAFKVYDDRNYHAKAVIRTAILLCFDEAENYGYTFDEMLDNVLLIARAENLTERE